MWTQSLQKSCLHRFCKSIPFSWSFMEICSRSLGRSGTALKAEAHDTVLNERIFRKPRKMQRCFCDIAWLPKAKMEVKAIWQTIDPCSCGCSKWCPYCSKTNVFFMYVAKRLVLLVSNMKNQCKMLRDGFIQAQLVSRSVYPGKDSPLKQYVKHPLINLPRFCLTPFQANALSSLA